MTAQPDSLPAYVPPLILVAALAIVLAALQFADPAPVGAVPYCDLSHYQAGVMTYRDGAVA
jgi:hypothetical protein